MKRGLIAVIACLGLAWAVTAAEEPPQPTPPSPENSTPAPALKPKIKFDQLVYDFGKTAQVERVSGTFVFHNVGNGVLKMGRPTTTCGCTVAGVHPEVLQPGEKGELTFTLSLGKTRAILQKQITVESNDPETPRTVLTVKADYTPLYTIMPLSYYLNIRKGETTNLIARVTRTDGKPFTISKLVPSQPWIQAKAEPEAGSTNHIVQIHTTLAPDGTPRYMGERVDVYMEGSEQPNFTLTFNGRLIGDLILTPESLYWPISDPSKAVTSRRVILRSSVPGKLAVSNVTSTLPGLDVEAVAKEDGRTVELVAKLQAIPDRTTNGVIRFDTNLPGQPHGEVPVWVNIMKKQAAR